MAKNYLITGVEPKLYREFKTACAYFGITAKETLIKHMENIVEDYIKDISMLEKRISRVKKGGKKK